MAIEDFLRTWRVLGQPQPIGEDPDHLLPIERDGNSNNVTITCAVHPVRQARYLPQHDRIEGQDTMTKQGYSICIDRSCHPHRIVCRPSESNTGSWTAEDTSGEGET